MRAEVISIGDELTSGQRLDTNSQWLSERLGELGVTVMFHTTVADDLAANVLVFRQAAERADVVVATGGLGPTADDLTRDAVAAVAGTPLVLDEAALRHIEGLFARRNRPMPESNRQQAYFPQGSRVVPNPHGTAPGIDVEITRRDRPPCRIFALPGVPAEMREMWRETVAPAIRALGEGKVIVHRRIKCFGAGESELEKMLPDLIRRGREPLVGITASGATITLRITAAGASPEAALLAMEPTVLTIRDCLGDLVFGEEDDELPEAVLRLLAERGQTLATVEWGSGGMLAHWFSEARGGKGEAYRGGIVGPDATLGSLLELRADDAAQLGGEAGVKQMAAAAREKLSVDYVLAIGEYPAPPASKGEAAPFHYAVAAADGVTARTSPFAAHPDLLKTLSAKRAVNLLRLELLRRGRAADRADKVGPEPTL